MASTEMRAANDDENFFLKINKKKMKTTERPTEAEV